MATPTAWQLGEDLKGKLLPVLRDVRELLGKIDLEISHKKDEMEFGSMTIRKTNNPIPEDPEKMKKLGENLIERITEITEKYKILCLMEANKNAVQETGHVTTTCPDIEENQAENVGFPTTETELPSPFCTSPELMEYQETVLPDNKSERSNSRARRLQRRAAVEDEETVDLGKD